MFFFWDFFWLFQRNFEIGLPIWCFLTWEIWCLDLFESSTYLVFVHWIPETPETWWNPRIIYHNHNLVNHWINYQSKDKMFLVEFSFCNPNSVRNLSDIIVNIYRGFLEGWKNITLKKGASKMLCMFFFLHLFNGCCFVFNGWEVRCQNTFIFFNAMTAGNHHQSSNASFLSKSVFEV